MFFLYFMFPFNDLGDFAEAKISEMTSKQVQVNFEKLDLALVPQPAMALSNVSVSTPATPSLTAKSLSIAPSLTGLMSFKPGVKISAEGILGGEIDLSTKGGAKMASGKRKQEFDIDLSDISLASLLEMSQAPVKITGSLSATVDGELDPEFAEQPTADINMKVKKISFNESAITTGLGPILLPKVDIEAAEFEGKADKGSIQIAKLILGKPGQDLYANISGRMDLRMDRMGPSVYPRLGAYDLTIRLQLGESVKQKLSSFLGLLSSYSNGPNSYSFRAVALNPYAPPQLSRAQ